eukprot:CAMPEP_0113694350 /NCGR_PEP_ID=MMETSP0038_2-20120614/20232_1 /TAXON_ID=2898 /ORGANISM="Cryptomonas paramecium" /LENGTH=71 /DNA_ID=CAMNT_0000616645 /DNA_START=172 /DNA_END=387 /DNA_ORIENTATION=+ /assembly_acc=CAM_ASM_000170
MIQNRELKDPSEIEEKIKAAYDRIDLAVHYKIPYPRQHHQTTGSADIRDVYGAYHAYDEHPGGDGQEFAKL